MFGIDDAIIIPALVSAGASLLSSGASAGSTSNTNKTNLQIARERNQMEMDVYQDQKKYNQMMQDKANAFTQQQQEQQNAFQRAMAGNQTAYQVHGARAAGVNATAALAGNMSAPSTGVNGPVSSAMAQAPSAPSLGAPMMQAPDVSALNALADIPLKAAQTNLINKQADEKDIQVKHLRDFDKYISRSHSFMVNPFTGQRLSEEQMEEVDRTSVFTTRDPKTGKEVKVGPDTVIIEGFSSLGALNAHLKMSEVPALIAGYDASRAYAELQACVATQQGLSSDVLNSLVNMPRQEFMQLTEGIAKIVEEKKLIKNQAETELERKNLVIAEKDLKDIEKKIKENASISHLLEKLGSSNLSWSDKITALIGFVVAASLGAR